MKNDCWKFVSYEKIPETWNFIENDYRKLKKVQWIVTEKIHGANFCFITNGNNIKHAKRKSLLSEDEDFFGYKSLKIDEKVKTLFKNLRSRIHDITKAFIYGEIFGGIYPHCDVKKNPNVQPVQTGVYYSPNIEFAAFDIAVEKNNDIKTRNYLDYDKALELLDDAGIFYIKPLFIGKYEKAISYPVEFESTISKLLGFPKLNIPNKAEGVVIKPLKSIYIDAKKGKLRPILKKKIMDFEENKKFHEAKKWEVQKKDYFKDELESLINKNRLNNVISKIGRINEGNKEELINMFYEDILEEINYISLKESIKLDLKEKIKKFVNSQFC